MKYVFVIYWEWRIIIIEEYIEVYRNIFECCLIRMFFWWLQRSTELFNRKYFKLKNIFRNMFKIIVAENNNYKSNNKNNNDKQPDIGN